MSENIASFRREMRTSNMKNSIKISLSRNETRNKGSRVKKEMVLEHYCRQQDDSY